jgi:[citrate (pro-3S)-lyase] ligase
VILSENGEIAATGSLDGGVLKCVAVGEDRRNEGLAARIVTEIITEAARRGRRHLFVFTKPENKDLFGSLGFYPLAETGEALLMENRKEGVKEFAAALECPSGKASAPAAGKAGAVVMNCNPFTRGHLHLIETAAARCGLLRVFVVAEDRSEFSPETRLDLVTRGTAHIPNVWVHSTGPYLVSPATFPDYFLKDSVSPEEVNTALDIAVFAECFARPLGIKFRFAGAEPLDPVTAVYNRQMGEILPRYGIEFVEIPRLEFQGRPISASRLRSLLREGKREEAEELLPPVTWRYLEENAGEWGK